MDPSGSSQPGPENQSTPASVPSSVVQDTAPPGKKKSLYLMLFVIAVLILVAAGYFVYAGKKNAGTNSDQAMVAPSVTPEPSAEPASVNQPVISPNPISPMPTKAPKTENEFYLQIGTSLKNAFK